MVLWRSRRAERLQEAQRGLGGGGEGATMFTITWLDSDRRYATVRATPSLALRKAIELMGRGCQEVKIHDRDKTYSPADFDRAHADIGARPADV